MNLYYSTFNKTNLLFHRPIEVRFNKEVEPVLIYTPTLEDILFDNDINLMINLINDKDTLKTDLFSAETRLEKVCGFLKYSDIFNKGFEKIFPNLIVDNTKLKVGNYILSSEEFDELCRMFLVAICFLPFEEEKDQEQVDLDDEEIKKYKQLMAEQEAKIKKAKSNSKQKKFLLDEAIICVLSYYPQYKVDDLLKLNYYTFFTLYEWSIKREASFVNDVAAGNGLLAKENKWQPLF